MKNTILAILIAVAILPASSAVASATAIDGAGTIGLYLVAESR